MLILECLKAVKKAAGEGCETFAECLERAKGPDFENKAKILAWFSNVTTKEKGSLVHFKYDNKKMFDLPWEDFYKEARACVMDWKAEELVLHPFDKFFELDEHKTTSLSAVKKAMKESGENEVTEKIDGSLIVARCWKGEALVVSSGALESPHVEIAKELLEKSEGLGRFMREFPEHTFIFEMKTVKHPQLVKYGEDSLTIIGMRDMETGRLLLRSEIEALAASFEAAVCPAFDLSMEQMLAVMEDPNATNMEGYILRIGDLLVKMKTKNFIMANRFAGEPARNFNMMVEAFQEGRLDAIRPMIKADFLESFDLGANMIRGYAESKQKKLEELAGTVPADYSKERFVHAVKDKYPKHASDLIAMKIGKLQTLGKEDIRFLKQFSEYLTCVSHLKYAELNGLSAKEVERRIESGEIKTMRSFTYSRDASIKIHIIHKWQFVDLRKARYAQAKKSP